MLSDDDEDCLQASQQQRVRARSGPGSHRGRNRPAADLNRSQPPEDVAAQTRSSADVLEDCAELTALLSARFTRAGREDNSDRSSETAVIKPTVLGTILS